jgi:hypothetical protein
MSKKSKTTNQQKLLSPTAYIKTRARNLPISECYVNNEWDDSKMANVVVVRSHSNGNKTLGMYLVDLFCLGVKDSTFRFNQSMLEYEEFISEISDAAFTKIDYELAHNIIYAGIEFAETFGIYPCKEFQEVTRYILEEDTDAIDVIEIECGYDDKPMIIVGPHNKIQMQKTIAHLEKKVGKDGFIVKEVLDEMDDDDSEYDSENEDDDVHFMEKYAELAYDEDDEDFKDKLNADIDKFKLQLGNTKLDKVSDDEKKQFVLLIESLFVNLSGFKKIEVSYINIANAFDFNLYEGDDIPDRLICGSNKLLPSTLESYRGEVRKFMSTQFKSNKEEAKELKKFAKKQPQILLFQLFSYDDFFIQDKPKEMKLCIENIEKIDSSYWLLNEMKGFVKFDESLTIDSFERMLNGENLTDVFNLDFDITFEEKALFYSLFLKYLIIKENIVALALFAKMEYLASITDYNFLLNIESMLFSAKTAWIIKQLGIR